jgi:glycosyltransferase involved in cell wall biosynthesis
MPAATSSPRHILAVFPSFAVGGAQTRYAALAAAFGPAARHSLIALDGRLECREKIPASIDATYLTPPPPANPVAAIAAAWQVMRKLRPDVVLTSNWGSMDWAIAAKLAGIAHVHSEDGFGPEERDRQLPRRILARRLILRGSEIVLPSRTLLDLAANIWRLQPRQLHYIPNGIDLVRFGAAAPTALPGGPGPVIGTIAALRPEKNLRRLIDAFAMLGAALGKTSPARLIIAGDGAERPGLQAYAEARVPDGRVIFTGYCAAPERLHAAFDILAMSSDTEQMPLAVLEAMAAGKPIVATDVGDTRAMVAPENAAFIVAKESGALAQALATLLADPERARRIGAANRAKAAAEYGAAAMISTWARLLMGD